MGFPRKRPPARATMASWDRGKEAKKSVIPECKCKLGEPCQCPLSHMFLHALLRTPANPRQARAPPRTQAKPTPTQTFTGDGQQAKAATASQEKGNKVTCVMPECKCKLGEPCRCPLSKTFLLALLHAPAKHASGQPPRERVFLPEDFKDSSIDSSGTLTDLGNFPDTDDNSSGSVYGEMPQILDVLQNSGFFYEMPEFRGVMQPWDTQKFGSSGTSSLSGEAHDLLPRIMSKVWPLPQVTDVFEEKQIVLQEVDQAPQLERSKSDTRDSEANEPSEVKEDDSCLCTCTNIEDEIHCQDEFPCGLPDDSQGKEQNVEIKKPKDNQFAVVKDDGCSCPCSCTKIEHETHCQEGFPCGPSEDPVTEEQDLDTKKSKESQLPKVKDDGSVCTCSCTTIEHEIHCQEGFPCGPASSPRAEDEESLDIKKSKESQFPIEEDGIICPCSCTKIENEIHCQEGFPCGPAKGSTVLEENLDIKKSKESQFPIEEEDGLICTCSCTKIENEIHCRDGFPCGPAEGPTIEELIVDIKKSKESQLPTVEEEDGPVCPCSCTKIEHEVHCREGFPCGPPAKEPLVLETRSEPIIQFPDDDFIQIGPRYDLTTYARPSSTLELSSDGELQADEAPETAVEPKKAVEIFPELQTIPTLPSVADYRRGGALRDLRIETDESGKEIKIAVALAVAVLFSLFFAKRS